MAGPHGAVLRPRSCQRRTTWLWYAVCLATILGLGHVYSNGNALPRDVEAVDGRSLSESGGLSHANSNCTMEGDTYPNDLILSYPYCESKHKWTIMFHFLGVVYMFYGIGLVCDEYFVPALEMMSDKYQITEDVAGATFMAAGGSAPEFFTSLVGVTVSKNDVGFGTIVGSAVFNVLFVIGLCGVFASETLQLTWWPLFRDCNYYIVSLLILSYFIRDSYVSFYEALCLFFLYIGYVTVMKYNAQCKKFVNSVVPWGDNESHSDPSSIAAVVPEANKVFKTGSNANAKAQHQPTPRVRRPRNLTPVMIEVRRARSRRDGTGLPNHILQDLELISESFQFRQSRIRTKRVAIGDIKGGLKKFKEGARRVIDNEKTLEYAEHILQNEATKEDFVNMPGAVGYDNEERDLESAIAQTPGCTRESSDGSDDTSNGYGNGSNTNDDDNEEEEGGGGDVGDDEDEDGINPFEIPEETKEKIAWAITFPIDVVLYLTIPQCNLKKHESKYLVSFFMSLVWIAIYAYVMVWWITIIGAVLNIDSTIMGLTLIAAGTSIPDALSSIAVAKEGYGDMAVSSSIGSNVFDILVGLPVPWMIKTGIIHSLKMKILIKSDYLFAQTITLIMMVGFLILSIMLTGWKLGKKLGLLMFLLYVVFLVISLYMEFGKPEWLRNS